MADRRKSRKKKEEDVFDTKPSKVEYQIAKYLRDKVPIKKTNLLGHKVDYFTASKAVDCLFESKWTTGEKKMSPLFTNRDGIVQYLDLMLRHKFFHRARKIQVSSRELSARLALKKGKQLKDKEKEKEEKPATGSDQDNEEEAKGDADKKQTHKLKEEGEDGKKKEKRKYKLDMHFEQLFLDGNEAYVWIYDPVSTTSWIIGGLMVFGAVAICLFPLWPPLVRQGVYYLSLAAAGFLVFIIALAIIRVIVFGIVWALTWGRHHLWLLPNLTEDVGFFQSFWPLFKYEYKPNDDKKNKKKKKDKKSDSENEDGDPGAKPTESVAKLLDDERGERGEAEDENRIRRRIRDNNEENDSNGFEVLGDEEFEDQGGEGEVEGKNDT